MKRLKKLKPFPVKVYSFDADGDYVFHKLEESGVLKNYSGGVSINKIHGFIEPLRDGYYKVLELTLGEMHQKILFKSMNMENS